MLLVLIMRDSRYMPRGIDPGQHADGLATGVTYDQVIPTMLTGFGGTWPRSRCWSASAP